MDPTVKQDGVPVGDYWLEHRRAMVMELQMQRSTMLAEIAESQRSALLGIELVRSKLEEDIEAFYSEFRQVLNAVTGTLHDGWRKIQEREKSLFALQQELNSGLATHLKAAKEQVMRNAELEMSYAERKEQLEQWACNCQDVILKREEELGATARKLDSDMSAIMIARKRLQSYDQQVAMRPGTVAKIVPAAGTNNGVARIGAHKDDGATDDSSSVATGITGVTGLNINADGSGGEDEGVIQVPVGEPFDLEFTLEMNPVPETVDRREYPTVADFANVPCTISYLEGKKGAVWGTVQTLVAEGGVIKLSGVRLQGSGGSSHILLVSMPRSVSGNVHPLELRVHLYTVPKIDVVGAWKPDVRALVGRIRLRHAEPFSVANKKMQLQLVVRSANDAAMAAAAAAASDSRSVGTRSNFGGVGGRSISAASTATTAALSTGANAALQPGGALIPGGGGRVLRAECAGDAQGDFAFTLSLPNHVWEELEQSLLTLEFRTPNLVSFPALEHRFDVAWMHVHSKMGTTPSAASESEQQTWAKIPMFRHPPEDVEPLSFSTMSCAFPKSDLITDFAVADSANLCLLAEVSNKVSLLRYEFPQRWVRARTMLLPVDDAHVGGVAFSRSGNVFAVHDTTSKTVMVWSVQKALKHAAADPTEATELEPADFVVDYTTVVPKNMSQQQLSMQSEDLLATHIKPIEDVLGTSLLVFAPATGLHLFFAGGNDGNKPATPSRSTSGSSAAALSGGKRPVLLVEPRGQNSVRQLFHKVLPGVGGMCMLGYDNGEVLATATAATKATGKRVQFRFSVVKGSPIAAISDGPTPDSFLCCTICTVCVVKTQPTWSVLRCSYVTSSPIAAVSFGATPAGVELDSEEKDGVAVVTHTSGLVAAVGIVTGAMLGSAMLPEVGETQDSSTVSNAQCANAGDLGARLVASSSLKPVGWEVKLVSPSGEVGSKPPVPVLFQKQQQQEKQEEEQEQRQD